MDGTIITHQALKRQHPTRGVLNEIDDKELLTLRHRAHVVLGRQWHDFPEINFGWHPQTQCSLNKLTLQAFLKVFALYLFIHLVADHGGLKLADARAQGTVSSIDLLDHVIHSFRGCVGTNGCR
jgi:hypothetical protein